MFMQTEVKDVPDAWARSSVGFRGRNWVVC